MDNHSSDANLTKTLANVTVDHEGVAVPEGCMVLIVESGGFIPWDNPDNIISQDVERVVDTAVGAICLPVLFIISAPTNILNMLVFWRQGLKERINLCLFYLSLVDFLHMLHGFFCNVDRLLSPFTNTGKYGPVFHFLIDSKLIGFRSITWLSGFISMLIACERCFCIVSPLRSQTVLSARTTGLILLMFTVFCLIGAAFMSLRWTVDCVYDPINRTVSKALLASQAYLHNKTLLDLLTLLLATIQPFIYVNIILATTVVTSLKLNKMVAWRERTSSYTLSFREVALTRMLIAASVLYIICSIPTTVLGVSVMFVPDMNLNGRYYNLSNLLLSFYELASFINATFNFFVYLFLGTKYKKTLRAVLRCKSPASTTSVSFMNPGAKQN